MKYLKVSLLLFLACSTLGLAQPTEKSFPHDKYNAKYYPAINKHGVHANYSVAHLNSDCKVTLKVDTLTKAIEPFNEVDNQPLTTMVFLEGTKEIKLTTDVHKDSLSFYRYSVSINDQAPLFTDAIPQKVDFIYPPGSDLPGTAIMNLGVYQVENKKLTLRIYKLPENNKVSTVIIYNKPIQPAEIFLVYLHKQLKKGSYAVDMNNLPQGVTIKMAENLKGLLFSIRNTDINFVYHVFLKDVSSGKTIPLYNHWRNDYIEGNPYQLIDASYFDKRGDYELTVVPILSSGRVWEKRLTPQATTFRFTIQKETTFTKKEIALLLATLVLAAGIIIFLLRARSNKRLAKEKQEKEISQLQLNLVRAQLNPHFMFNALAGIQNLMNKNDTENANRYLGKFARLTRNVLKNQELIPLEEEIALLEDYLQMEKLRFGFQYTIHLDDTIDAANVEIPAMLLQPFVENAIKHGISGLQDKGRVCIRFERHDKDLLLLLRDNGSGFDPDAPYAGLGLSLSRSRVALLNKIYKNTPILLHISSAPTGTEVKISLAHWL